MTSSSSQSLDKQPLPWFSSEVRDVGDQRIRWLVLDEWSTEADQDANTHPHHRDEGFAGPNSPEIKQAQGRKSPRIESADKDADVAVAGHYLNHIEAVQQRDQKQKTVSSRRKRHKKRKTTAARSQSSGSNKKTSAAQTEPTVQAQGTKPKSRRSRSRRSKPKS